MEEEPVRSPYPALAQICPAIAMPLVSPRLPSPVNTCLMDKCFLVMVNFYSFVLACLNLSRGVYDPLRLELRTQLRLR